MLKDLKKRISKNVEIEPNVERLGYRGDIVHICLPEEGNFKGFKFDYFISYDKINKKKFESDPRYELASHSMEDVDKLLDAMNKYMEALGFDMDGNMDYERELKSRKTGRWSCKVGDYLKELMGLKDSYWMSNTDVAGEKSRIRWDCMGHHCAFDRRSSANSSAKLFLMV